jgi:hypothetical protein
VVQWMTLDLRTGAISIAKVFREEVKCYAFKCTMTMLTKFNQRHHLIIITVIDFRRNHFDKLLGLFTIERTFLQSSAILVPTRLCRSVLTLLKDVKHRNIFRGIFLILYRIYTLLARPLNIFSYLIS